MLRHNTVLSSVYTGALECKNVSIRFVFFGGLAMKVNSITSFISFFIIVTANVRVNFIKVL